MIMIEAKYFTALPSGDNSVLLSEEYRKLLLLNLIGYLTSIQYSLKFDISPIIKKYQNLNTSHNFSPTIYDLFTKLVRVSNAGDVPPIIDVLHQLNILPEYEIMNSEFHISTILTEPWEWEFINKIRKEKIPNKSNENTLLLPILNSDISSYCNVFHNLKELVKQVDLLFYKEIENYVTRLKLFNGKGLKAATSASVFGAIYLRTPPANENVEAYFADHIIHETSHLSLDILLAFDKIVLNEEQDKFKAPIRIDPRPMFGIFHATFVLSRMVRLFQRIISESPKREFIERLYLFRKQFDQGLETVEKYAILTENGQRIKESFVKTAEI